MTNLANTKRCVEWHVNPCECAMSCTYANEAHTVFTRDSKSWRTLLPDWEHCRCRVASQAVLTCDSKRSGGLLRKHCFWSCCHGRHGWMAAWRSAPRSFQPLKSPSCRTLAHAGSPWPISAVVITCCMEGTPSLSMTQVSERFSYKFGMPGTCSAGATLDCMMSSLTKALLYLGIPQWHRCKHGSFTHGTVWLLLCFILKKSSSGSINKAQTSATGRC